MLCPNIVHRIPLDVYRLIFSYYMPKGPALKARDTPLVLTHVCRDWRDAALEISSLWSFIVFPCWSSLPKGIDSLLALWLVRSSRAKWLDITIRFFDEDDGLGAKREIKALQADIDSIDKYGWIASGLDSPYTSNWSFMARKLRHLKQFLLALAPHHDRIRSIKGSFPLKVIELVKTHEMRNAQSVNVTFYNFYPR